jgi:hypothetical protein
MMPSKSGKTAIDGTLPRQMPLFAFFATIESRGDGLHPILRSGVADAGLAAKTTRQVDELVRAERQCSYLWVP